MNSPVSADTHKEYKTYSNGDAIKLNSFIGLLQSKAASGSKTPYNTDTFVRHAGANRQEIKRLVSNSLLRPEPHDVDIPASILFWVYRGCAAMDIRCPVEVPHICKLPSPQGEKFFVTTKEDWAAHRAATVPHSNKPQVSDHAKLQYLSRVLGINIESMLSSFPEITGKGEALADGRTAYEIGDFTYIVDNGICVTILSKRMVVI